MLLKKPDTKDHVLYDSIYMKHQNRQIRRDWKMSDCIGLVGTGLKWEVTANGMEFLLGWWNVLKLDNGNGYTSLWIY